MIRLKLFIQGEKHPMKAWRSETGKSWELASEVASYVIEKDIKEEIRVSVDQTVTNQTYSVIIPSEKIAQNAGKRNGPLLRIIKSAIETLEGAPDLVQERINQGQY